MNILTAEQVRQWDQYTIEHEPVQSIDLMERAAMACTQWIEHHTGSSGNSYAIFCGKGNNGGDGLAIARMLAESNQKVTVHILEFGHLGTLDFQANLARLHQYPAVEIKFIQPDSPFHEFTAGEWIIDALFGTGLNRALEGVTARLVEYLNNSGHPIISIDLPSGLFADKSSLGNPVIRAQDTLSFQCYKPAFLFAENAPFTGEVHILDIGLVPGFPQTLPNRYQWLDGTIARSLYKPRNAFAHKGNFGHALLLVGSYGKMGAAVLAARACLRSGAGLLTCYIPGSGYDIMQTAAPEAMVITTDDERLAIVPPEIDKYSCIGLGPGLGTGAETLILIGKIFSACEKPMVIDADALNLLSIQPDLLSVIPNNSILTPHPKEFDRLFGGSENDFDRAEKASAQASRLQCIIVLKGHHTLIAMPGGQYYFNNTGNAGMAKGGSGDVLTGLMTGILARGYAPEAAALFAVYLHGLAGDLAASLYSEESMTASDIIDELGQAFMDLDNPATDDYSGI